ncbi:outer membrane beta-barrel protein [Cytophagaceae bacterium YF14B1]|uniref:Outer membrane beta-barrel protein n=1 Tax=Xanthocytophaga flava TaxID=3048013 RepID=A0AAE3QQP4_9BACT|nr:outer membrane beta-barrel protein [Xanthocytophaga flavus]MDJ1481119.1 outer membrane beta-barrel protein [Xanthocytophaga flavus]
MLKAVLTTLSFIFLSPILFAQTNFIKGTIVDLNGNTQEVLIKDKADKYNSLECSVKSLKQNAVVRYKPADIKGYSLENGKVYQSYYISVPDTKDSVLVFLQKLVEGEVVLYFYRGKQGKDRYFIQIPPEGLMELDGAKDSYVNGQRYRSEGNYRENLKSVMSKCPIEKSSLDELKMTRARMTSFIASYNLCPSINNLRYQYENPKSKILLGVKLGASLGQVDFGQKSSNDLYAYPVENVPVRWQPAVGITAAFQMADIDKKLYFQSELLFMGMQIKDYKTQTGLFKKTVIIDKIQNYFIQLPLLFRYNLLNTRLTPYVSIGGAVSYNILAERTITKGEIRRITDASLSRKVIGYLVAGGGVRWESSEREYSLDYRLQKIILNQLNDEYNTSFLASIITLSAALEKKKQK